jgi:hypothetical protein
VLAVFPHPRVTRAIGTDYLWRRDIRHRRHPHPPAPRRCFRDFVHFAVTGIFLKHIGMYLKQMGETI